MHDSVLRHDGTFHFISNWNYPRFFKSIAHVLQIFNIPKKEISISQEPVYRCTMFGTSQTWDIPDGLRGLRRNSGAFKAWYIAKVRLTRKSLAARGNIQACKSIKETKDRRRLYMKRRRDYQRVVAQHIALGENAAPWGALAASLEHEENLS